MPPAGRLLPAMPQGAAAAHRGRVAAPLAAVAKAGARLLDSERFVLCERFQRFYNVTNQIGCERIVKAIQARRRRTTGSLSVAQLADLAADRLREQPDVPHDL
jgi:hypothetical protein